MTIGPFYDGQVSDADSVGVESTRRRLKKKQADTVERLTKVAIDVLARTGYDALTVRIVAAEAGVGTATAYTYFSSKEHLIAEAFWRRLAQTPPPDHAQDADRVTRTVATLRQIALLLGDEPEMANAVTTALLGGDPDVEHLRLRIGAEMRRRLVDALGPEADPDLVESLELLYSGALLRAGMGYASYAEIADRMETTARMLFAACAV
ncbi:TetR/AcrR family transcriptional regulator [Nocardia alni]|uniref:TetR/AcrR family transcriptional regulator n=1 Tax=Nocardia alni TaxID=2815723 RepID=UPI001C239DBA|nr:TetR/AcrR family transcriptional regulator [Nocardia alni]